MESSPLGPLSARELDVLRALSDHGTNAEIAAGLFLSVRTVESHVASLLRKTGQHDRRDLIRLAPGLLGGGEQHRAAPLTSLVGRERERERVAAALAADRLVTIVGPGGAGKTRLALDVLEQVRDHYPAGAAHVDLVPLADPSRLPSVLVERFGLAERGSPESALAARFGAQRGLAVLDSCEHLGPALAGVLEALLEACPGLSVLATSRRRLAVPFETVVRIDGLPVAASVRLFLERAASAGWPVDDEDRARVETICRGLEGLPLALELAAAQVAGIGVDGVEAALADPLALLAGGSRAARRHGSLRATLEWSHDLLDPVDRAILRRLSVITGSFSADAAAAVAAGWAPVPAAGAPLLAALADASLLALQRTAEGTRYRLHDVVRRFAEEQAAAADEAGEAESRLLAWCSAMLDALPAGSLQEQAVDADLVVARVAVEQAAARRGAPDAPLAALARRMAAVLLARGTPAEAQQLSELAATLAATPEEAGRDLDEAAGAAELRGAGDTAQELRRASADAFAAGGSPAAAAEQLARAAEALNRTPGHLLTFPAEGAAEALTDAARALAGDDPRASSRILTAMVFADLGRDPDGQAREAVELARRAGDVAGESAALDAQGSRAMDRGDLRAAYAIQIRRIALLETAPATASVALEYQDALQTAADFALALGELDSALRFAQAIGALAGLAAERHLAVAPLLLAHVIRGELRSALALTDVFLASWTRAGRPVIGALSAAAYAAATAFALSGDDEQAASWRAIAVEVFGARERLIDFERPSSTCSCCCTVRTRPARWSARGPRRRRAGRCRSPAGWRPPGDPGTPCSAPRRRCSPGLPTPPRASRRRRSTSGGTRWQRPCSSGPRPC